MKLYQYLIAALCTALLLLVISCTKDKVKDDSEGKRDNINNGESIFSEKFKKTGWINNNRYRAVIHIFTYEQCISTRSEIIKDDLEIRAFRNIRNELGTTGSRDADVHILNLIKNHGIILRPDLTCGEINIYYFDINKKNLINDFKYIQSIK